MVKSKCNISKTILERIWLFCEISFVLRRLHSFFVCGRFGSTAVLHTRTKSAFKKVWVTFKCKWKGWWNSRGHKRQIFVDKMGEFSWTFWVNSPKVSTRIHPLKMSTRIRPFWKKCLWEFTVYKNSPSQMKATNTKFRKTFWKNCWSLL